MAQFCRLTLAGPEGPDRGKKVFRSGMWLGALSGAQIWAAPFEGSRLQKAPPENPEFRGMPLRQERSGTQKKGSIRSRAGVDAGRHQRVSKSGPAGGGGRGTDDDCTADDGALGCGFFLLRDRDRGCWLGRRRRR